MKYSGIHRFTGNNGRGEFQRQASKQVSGNALEVKIGCANMGKWSKDHISQHLTVNYSFRQMSWNCKWARKLGITFVADTGSSSTMGC